MANKGVPELMIGDRFMAYGMLLEVEALRHFERRNGYGVDCTQAKCRIVSGGEKIPRVYTDDEAGTHFTVQGNELARYTTLNDDKGQS